MPQINAINTTNGLLEIGFTPFIEGVILIKSDKIQECGSMYNRVYVIMKLLSQTS